MGCCQSKASKQTESKSSRQEQYITQHESTAKEEQKSEALCLVVLNPLDSKFSFLIEKQACFMMLRLYNQLRKLTYSGFAGVEAAN